MTPDQKQFSKLMKKWEEADVRWKKASKRYQQATAGYHWTAADDGAKWKRALALRDQDSAAFQKARAAYKALVAFTRSRLNP